MKFLSLSEYRRAPRAAKRRFCNAIARKTEGRFKVVEPSGAWRRNLPTFEHVASGIRFAYIPPGTFRQGFSAAEEAAAKKIDYPFYLAPSEMRPVRKVNVDAFLMSVTPVLRSELSRTQRRLLVGEGDEHYPAFVTHASATAICRKMDCRLPYESEWEYACRAGKKSLFVWGNALPSHTVLEGWIDNIFATKEGSLGFECKKCNAFGLFGLSTGEWCRDLWRPSYAPDARPTGDGHVVRGGGSLFWQWQDQEWVWAMSAMRTNEAATIDSSCGFRPIYELSGI